MGLIELIIVVLVILWLFGYFGRGRWYATGPGVSTGTSGVGWASGSWIHLLIVLAVILLLLRLLGVV
jgi:Family of unknown function (DUF5670)